ncbi:MAG: hypothetical protein EAZ44_03965 [Cytophagia bacterium]|nr:MAG: hypothetical protein EAZ44_03965 [Cytophagia bacterium]TAG43760.1 MAG: hypothetical protein EAZ31_03640 [Cytophagia bacterium]
MKLFIVLSLVSVMFLSSCAVTLPVAATSNPIGSKVGSAKTTRILGIFFFDGGDAGIQKAAKNGGITKVSTVDFRTSLVFLSLVVSHETIITGE